jgi:hypothetical protein
MHELMHPAHAVHTRIFDTRYLQLKAACCFSLNRYHEICECNGDPLPHDAAIECHRVAYDFLETYSALARFALEHNCEDDGPCWHLVPKHHYFCHLADHVLRTSANPSYHHCFLDEDLVGRVAKAMSEHIHTNVVVVVVLVVVGMDAVTLLEGIPF